MRFLRYLFRLLADFCGFARQHKAWWIVPLVITLLVLALIMVAVQTVAPYIYTLF
jgi:hypothetical protein